MEYCNWMLKLVAKLLVDVLAKRTGASLGIRSGFDSEAFSVHC